ncbi:MAG: pirin family protein [Planctomycetota bacterium]
MIETRTAQGRGTTDLGWLDSRHTFAFGRGMPSRDEPNTMGFRNLRVINDDRVAGGGGFGTHPHDNMEIISFVIEGSLEHKDSMGTTQTIEAGDFQLTSAGSGVTHSEYNPSGEAPMRFVQIWLIPNEHDTTPNYGHLTHDAEASRNRLRLVASPDGDGGSMPMHADARLFVAQLDAGAEVDRAIPGGHAAWVQVTRGTVRLTVGGETVVLGEGDGAAVTEEEALRIAATTGAEILVFDLFG